MGDTNEHPERDTEGRKRLTLWIEADPTRSQTTLAAAVGVKPSSVNRWLSGVSRPSEGNQREAIRIVTGVEPDDWSTPDELRVARARLSSAFSAAAEPVPVAKAAS